MANDKIEQLKGLQKLLEAGAVTPEEFNKSKTAILAGEEVDLNHLTQKLQPREGATDQANDSERHVTQSEDDSEALETRQSRRDKQKQKKRRAKNDTDQANDAKRKAHQAEDEAHLAVEEAAHAKKVADQEAAEAKQKVEAAEQAKQAAGEASSGKKAQTDADMHDEKSVDESVAADQAETESAGQDEKVADDATTDAQEQADTADREAPADAEAHDEKVAKQAETAERTEKAAEQPAKVAQAQASAAKATAAQAATPKKRTPAWKYLLAVLGIVLVFVAFFMVYGAMTQVTQEKLEYEVTKAIKDDDPDLLLKQFNEEAREMAWAKPGAADLLAVWRNSDVSTKRIVDVLARGDYDDEFSIKVEVESEPYLLFFKKYYLTTTATEVQFSNKYDETDELVLNTSKRALLTKNDDIVGSEQDVITVDDAETKGIFPGHWYFDIDDSDGRTLNKDMEIRGNGDPDDGMTRF